MSSHLGQWKTIGPKFNALPVHTALLHTGKVLAFGGSGNEPGRLNNWYEPEIYEPDYTGSTDGTIRKISNDGIEGDLFCVGHAYLPDGKLFLAGGTYLYDGLGIVTAPFPPFWGLDHTYTFDPDTEKFTRLPNMRYGRWYPTCVTMGDGKIATFAGLSKWPPWVWQPVNEIYDEQNNSWQKIEGGNNLMPLYPRMHLLPNGDLFYAGSYNTHMTFPFSRWGFKIATFSFVEKKWKHLEHPKDMHRQEGSTVLLPLVKSKNYLAEVILIGGGDMNAHATRTCEKISFKSGTKQKYIPTKSMDNDRYYVYPVILPDRNILVVGGKSGHNSHSIKHKCEEIAPEEIKHNDKAILDTELYNTETEEWSKLEPMKVDRLYHANAILLPDGKVMTMGSNPTRKCVEKRIEIFSPPYLFAGDRPVIDDVKSVLKYEESFEIQMHDGTEILDTALIRPSNTTHCLNPEQRYIEIDTVQNGDKISSKIPKNENLVPPGYYMLFVRNHSGVPCIAPFVRITH
ncbi:galactose oxidase early set domain-containing protein [Nitrosopumilus piranensis]|uniref:Putative Galactose oxidase n=1 Tax=Nitrosopumilus piranensis TaxID=1582439 RepID=A0A0C5CCL2_9ARCH|nr:galactose oxidase early set domain-containing protein [Nitrosopumilus piranensis]AJM92922.1 putative Galactose oxidase [Nitrosopumilus piranensis]